ncbi:hypothetical protein RvY_10029 [Ramazzottius varieornatus]|uniref:Uncharacterized protein n=1 Tax=Ramazzottius varieornatus TaxID=947166 RepID=A0A1D1VDI9_RAMVA|nr:hypothetical protein RvY_10029 [Ramazzottius varieornatus]
MSSPAPPSNSSRSLLRNARRVRETQRCQSNYSAAPNRINGSLTIPMVDRCAAVLAPFVLPTTPVLIPNTPLYLCT